jgi:hypothetical protein
MGNKNRTNQVGLTICISILLRDISPFGSFPLPFWFIPAFSFYFGSIPSLPSTAKNTWHTQLLFTFGVYFLIFGD